MEQFQKIAILENEFEAQILKSILTERGIEHYIKSFYDIAYDGLFQKSSGWGAIFAANQDEAAILEALAAIRNEPILQE